MSAHDDIQAMIRQIAAIRERNRLPYGNDLWWRLSDAIHALECADQATPEVRYADDERQGNEEVK